MHAEEEREEPRAESHIMQRETTRKVDKENCEQQQLKLQLRSMYNLH